MLATRREGRLRKEKNPHKEVVLALLSAGLEKMDSEAIQGRSWYAAHYLLKSGISRRCCVQIEGSALRKKVSWFQMVVR